MSVENSASYESLAEWSWKVREALKTRGVKLKTVSEAIGYGYNATTGLLSGRLVKQNYLDIAQKIDEYLGIETLPMKPELPSAEWCTDVYAKLKHRQKSGLDIGNINQLAKETGFSRDRLSLVLNGHTMDRPVIDAINNVLKIETPVSGSDLIIAESRVEKNGE